MRLFGLIGYPLSHSFSKNYFTVKFEKEEIANTKYELFPISSIEEFPELIQSQKQLTGLNVTIPYKETVIQYLDELDPAAREVGAVNVIKISGSTLTGYNSDIYGFEMSLRKHLQLLDKQALILGTGGAGKAVAFVLQKLGIAHRFVSRQPYDGEWGYNQLEQQHLQGHTIIINTTPLGMHPNINQAPDLPYHLLNEKHLLFDLVYNPGKTLFLKLGEKHGCRLQNGLEMLYFQAERAWEIWNE